jgi:hypothetical protein
MPIALPPEVPAYVRHENHIENHVQVQGGTNWDFSRSAVATPITVHEDEIAPGRVPSAYAPGTVNLAGAPVATVKFAPGSTLLPANMQKLLLALSPKSTYVVTLHQGGDQSKESALTTKRENAVISFLSKHGRKVQKDKASTAANPSLNAAVEIFVKP